MTGGRFGLTLAVACLTGATVISVAQTPAPRPKPTPKPAPPIPSKLEPVRDVRPRGAVVVLDSDETADISIDGEPSGVVRPENVVRLTVSAGSHTVQANSQMDQSVLWRGVVDLASGETKVVSVRLKPLLQAKRLETLIGTWKRSWSESGTYTNTTTSFSAQKTATLTVGTDAGRAIGRLSVASVYADASGGFTRDQVADLAIIWTGSVYEARVTAARTRDKTDNFKDLPSAAVTSFDMPSASEVAVGVSWSGGDTLDRTTLAKQTVASIAEEERRRGAAREAVIARYRLFTGVWRNVESLPPSGRCETSRESTRTLAFDPPSEKGVTGSIAKASSWRSRSIDCDRGGSNQTTRNLQILYDESKRAFVGTVQLISCRGDGCSNESTDDFVAQASQTELVFVYKDGASLTYRRQ